MNRFDHVYLDTNILIASNWPKLSAALENLFELAQVLAVKVLVPEAVEAELEQHWIRNLDKKYNGIDRTIKDFENYLTEAERSDIKLALPDKEKALASYRRRVDEIKKIWELESLPVTTRSTTELFRMAARRDAPFKEEGAGFQDAVIYLSVIDDLARSPKRIGALVSQDSIFKSKKDELVESAKSSEVALEIYHSLQDVIDALLQRLRAEMIREWEERKRKVENELKNQMPQIEYFIDAKLELSYDELGFGERLIEIKGFEVKDLRNVRIPIVRKSAEPEKISFELELELDVVIEKMLAPSTVISPPSVKVGAKAPPAEEIIFAQVFPPPKIEEYIIPWSVEVEAEVPAGDTEYKSIELSSLVSKGSGPKGLGLSRLTRSLSSYILK